MDWFQRLDTALFHWVNPALSNSLFDAVMPFFSGNPYFAPAVLLACTLLFWKGGARGQICVVMLLLAIALTDGVVCNTLKHVIARVRPCHVIANAHVPDGIGCTDSGSMPSSHAANWFAATIVLLIYYRRSVWFMLPLALIVSFSRLYNGVHYPSDVFAGGILGAGCSSFVVWTLDRVWQLAGRRWFPLWWERLPSLFNPTLATPRQQTPGDSELDKYWIRLAYVSIFVLLVVNLAYIAFGSIDLSEDEAYQWTWSRHLALSYISKPPLIAITQFLGTSIWGNNEFGVRFFSPVISAVMGLVMLRFMARVANARVAFWLAIIVPTVPLMALGSVLMTVDPLSVMFWALAMLAGWRAVQDNSTTTDWAWVGLWMGLGFLSKYPAALFQLLSWVAFFVLWPKARTQLKRPGPYLALLVTLLCTLPVLIWNWQHEWVTIRSVAQTGSMNRPWSFGLKNLNFIAEFLLSEAGLQNPFYFLPVAWAAVVFWKRKSDQPLLVYFFSMGAPLFLCALLYTLHSRVLPNWVAPSVIPLFCLAAVYWEQRWREGFHGIKNWLYAGIVFGCIAAAVMREPRLVTRLTTWEVPPKFDVWHRIQGWQETAAVVGAARERLLTEGKPVFIIGAHYGITGELSFYLPEAQAAIKKQALVYYITSSYPANQFYFWPGYRDRKGENAIFVQVLEFTKPETTLAPPPLVSEFESLKDLGRTMVVFNGHPVRYLQMWECRGLR